MSMPSQETTGEEQEQRLILRFLDAWEQAADSREMPSLRDFSNEVLAPFKAFSVLIDVQGGYDAPIIRHVGTEIESLMEEDYRGRHTDEVPRRSILSRVTDHFFETIANRAPVGYEAFFEDASGKEIPYRGILSPLSDDGDKINFILAVINWMGASSHDAPQLDADLPAALKDLQDRAASAGRSRQELYDLLADVYDFFLKGQQATTAYAALLKDHGIKAQARAPFTAVLKLALGSEYDKTRITEYAAAMSYGLRHTLDRDAFLDALHNTPGGLKALVHAERAARRTGSETGPAAGPTRATLDDLTPHAVVEDWRGPDVCNGDYVLLLARRSDGDNRQLAVLRALPASPQDLKRFAPAPRSG